MRRYFFHVRDGDTLHRDATRRDLANTDAVIKEAQHCAADALREALVRGQDASVCILEVADDKGKQVVTLELLRVSRRRVGLGHAAQDRVFLCS